MTNWIEEAVAFEISLNVVPVPMAWIPGVA